MAGIRWRVWRKALIAFTELGVEGECPEIGGKTSPQPPTTCSKLGSKVGIREARAASDGHVTAIPPNSRQSLRGRPELMAARQRDLHGPARAGSGNAIAVEQDRAGLDDVARIRIEQTGGRYRFHERE